MKEFVIGDIHGGYKSLVQCLNRSAFDYEKDKLICLGDISDGFPDTPLVVEELLKIKNLILVWGNHDTWFHQWLQFGSRPDIWTQQGGQATIDSYIKEPELLIKHRDFFNRAVKCYVDKKKRLFVHGGFQLGTDARENDLNYLTWDRSLYDGRNNDLDISPYTEVYVGHTTTWRISHYPFCRNGVFFMDTGGGWEGKLTIMNINTHEFWQSEVVESLYPGYHGR